MSTLYTINREYLYDIIIIKVGIIEKINVI